MRIVLAFLIALSFFAIPVAYSETDRFSEALSLVGLAPEDLKWDTRQLGDFQNDPFRFPWFDDLHQRPLEVPHEAKITLERFEGAKNSIRDLITVAARRSAHEVARWPYGLVPEITEKEPLFSSLAGLYKDFGWRLSGKSEQALKLKCGALSLPWQKELASFIGYALQVKQYRDLALRKIPKDKWQTLLARTPITLEEGQGFPVEVYDAALTYDASFMYYGAAQGALSIDSMLKLLESEVPASFDVDTPLGKVTIAGNEANTHFCQSQLLIIDTEGDDTYTGWVAGNSGFDNPFSVAIDIAGNDVYKTDFNHHNNCGSGRFGVGVLVDVAGDDIYNSVECSQGFGGFGVGALIDKSGNDSYSSIFTSQGSAEFGLGLLQDFEGNDVYGCYFASQGFGFTQGVGLLQDRAGNDTYVANDTDIILPSAQSDKHNTSMSQGAGYGLRMEFDNGHSMSGGCGILQDMEGDDTYSCGVFGQGVAYWHGMGVLSDYNGNDTYNGTWYVQGASAHFGIAYFQDRSGDDTYQATMATSIGVGHDTSLGYHIDLGGNDTYNCWRTEEKDGKETKVPSGLVVGCGNNNGMGFLVNVGGDDYYDVAGSPSLGMYGGPMPCQGSFMREGMINIGVFLEIGGKDTYVQDKAKDNMSWAQKPDPASPCEGKTNFGVGLDAKDGGSGPLF